jgi:mono/diheme cytochrome c family protein
MRPRDARRIAALLAAPLLTAGVAAAQEAILSGAAAGQVFFQTYCASCHGVAADGRGPVADSLRTRPADLTRLAAKHGAPLPRAVLAEFIDGRRDVAAHGPREMPIWGERFYRGSPETADSRERAKQRAIDSILDYLETIQVAR